jgi:hypothetical protein
VQKQGLNDRFEVEIRMVSRRDWAVMTRSYFPENKSIENREAEWGRSERLKLTLSSIAFRSRIELQVFFCLVAIAEWSFAKRFNRSPWVALWIVQILPTDNYTELRRPDSERWKSDLDVVRLRKQIRRNDKE